jgi:hypothetical protein
VNYRYLFHLTPALFMFAAIGVMAIRSDIGSAWGKALVLPAVIAALVVSGQGVIAPRTNYFLEADDPESFLLKNRDSFIFVPQPNWNAAYGFVAENRKAGDAIVTTQPPFNKLFLGEPGYWIRYSYNGKDYMQETPDGREFYVGSRIVRDAEELKDLAASSDGYVIFDIYAERRMPSDIRTYIRDELTEAFHEKTNSYSEVWVYRF